MTAQTPSAKASGASALLASLAPHPPATPPPGSDSFSAVISQALTAKGADADSPGEGNSPGTAAASQAKPASPEAGDPDPSSLLLALLAQSLSAPPPVPEWHKSSGSKTGIIATQAPATKGTDLAPKENGTEGKPAKAEGKNAPAAKTLALADEPASAATAKSALVKEGIKEAIQSFDNMTSSAPTPKPASVRADSSGAIAGIEKPAGESVKAQIPETDSVAGAAPNGTSAAMSSQRMNFSAERNEIAGQTEQKLPPGAVTGVTAVDGGGATGQRKAKSSLDLSWHDTPAQNLVITDPSAKGLTLGRDSEAASTPATSQLARLEQLISNEVVSIREKGADSLGVSVKVDANTQLFLQLTNHNGQLQATLRCERGDFTALDTQWTQLQQALARQNVQLLPPGNGATASFQQSSDHPQRQLPQSGGEAQGADAVVEAAQARKQKQQSRSRQSWESWA